MNDLNVVDNNGVSNSTDASASVASIAAAVDSVATAVRASRAGRKPDPTSRLGQARTIYANAPDKSRKAIITAFVNNIDGISKQIASAYYHQIVNAAKS